MSKHRWNVVWCGLIVLGLTAVALGADQSDHEKKWQGTWKVTFAEVGDKEAKKTDLKGLEVIVDGDKFTLVEGDRKEVVHFTLDADAKPHHIDFYKASDKKEKVWQGIYAFDGKDLKLCWGPAGEGRPKDFGAKKSNHNRYYIIKKQ